MEGKALRIAMISLHSSPLGEIGTRDTGGMSIYIRELANGLAGRGHSVDIFTRRQHRNQPQSTRLSEGVRVVHLDAGGWVPLPPPALSRHLQEFGSGLERFRSREGVPYDLVHSHYWLSGLVGQRVAGSWRVPHVVLFHTLGMLKNRALRTPIEPQARIRAERELYGESGLVIATTEGEKRALAELYGASRGRISVIPCGVNLGRFRPVEIKEARQTLDIAQKDEVVLYVGRFDPVKGMADLLKAIALMRDGPAVKLILVGGDADSAAGARKVRELVDDLCLDDRIRFAGRVEHESLPVYYSAADVLAMPSHYESFGLVALEALACGTPVAAPPVGAMETLLADGRGGSIVNARDPVRLADGLRRVLTDRKAGLYPPGRARAAAKPYDWATIAERVEAEYHGLLSEWSSGMGAASGFRANAARGANVHFKRAPRSHREPAHHATD